MPFSFAFARLNALQAAVRHPHSIVAWLICRIYNLAFSHCKSEVWYHCLSTQFGGEWCLPTIWVLNVNVFLHKFGMVAFLNNSGGYLCITAIWRYSVLWYWWYVPWLVSKISRSLCKSGYGNTVSLHNPGGELCLPTIKTDKSKTSHWLFGGRVLTDEKSVQKILRSIFNPTHHFVLLCLDFLAVWMAFVRKRCGGKFG